MPLPQDIRPFNTALVDTITRADAPWIEETPVRAFKVLWTGSESGNWAVLYRWKQGYVAPPHKHLSDSHTYIISGRLKVRDTTFETGDYVYEPCGVLHGATEALEDTEFLFICNGPLLYFNDNGFTGYRSWEELAKARDSQPA